MSVLYATCPLSVTKWSPILPVFDYFEIQCAFYWDFISDKTEISAVHSVICDHRQKKSQCRATWDCCSKQRGCRNNQQNGCRNRRNDWSSSRSSVQRSCSWSFVWRSRKGYRISQRISTKSERGKSRFACRSSWTEYFNSSASCTKSEFVLTSPDSAYGTEATLRTSRPFEPHETLVKPADLQRYNSCTMSFGTFSAEESQNGWWNYSASCFAWTPKPAKSQQWRQ